MMNSTPASPLRHHRFFLPLLICLIGATGTTSATSTALAFHQQAGAPMTKTTTTIVNGGSVGRSSLLFGGSGRSRSSHYRASFFQQQHRRQRRRILASSTTRLSMLNAGGALAALDVMFQSSPYTAAALTCGFKASAADFIAQRRQFHKRDDDDDDTSSNDKANNKNKKTDLQRNLAFVLYGSLYQGVSQEFIYNSLYPVMFGKGVSIGIVLSKVLFDLLIQTTLLTLPIAYLIKALIYKYSPREAIRRYWDDVKNHGLLKKYFMLWGPVQCCTFSIIPEHYRVTFIACVSFFWLIILSTIASKTPAYSAAAAAVQKDDAESSPEAHPGCELADGLTCNIDG